MERLIDALMMAIDNGDWKEAERLIDRIEGG